jgi:hypothetical protein
VDGKIILELKAVKALDHNMNAVAERTISSRYSKQVFYIQPVFPHPWTPRH